MQSPIGAAIALLTAAPFAFWLAGCGPDCVSLCEQMDEECDDDDIPLDTSDCEELCADIETITEDEKCEEELDEMLACVDALDDICDYTDDCDDEVGDWTECGCEDNPDDCAELLD